MMAHECKLDFHEHVVLQHKQNSQYLKAAWWCCCILTMLLCPEDLLPFLISGQFLLVANQLESNGKQVKLT